MINLIPIMTNNTSPSGRAFGSGINSTTFDYYRAFDRTITTSWVSSNMNKPFLAYDFGVQTYVDTYTLTCRSYNSADVTSMVRSWIFEGSNDGLSWEALDTRSNQSWTVGETKVFEVAKVNFFKMYRINILANNGLASASSIGDFGLFRNRPIVKIIVLASNNYYYYNNTWISLGVNKPTIDNALTYGMDSLGSEINSLVSSTGDVNPRVLFYSNNEFNNTAVQKAIPNPQLVYPTSDISLVGVETIDKLTLLSTGNAKIAISFDSGITQQVFKNGVWETVENAHSGMTNLELNTLTSQQIELGRNGSTHIRFSYSLSDNAEVDSIEMIVTMQGTEKLADTNDFTISYNQDTATIIYNIKKSGSYSVNYVSP